MELKTNVFMIRRDNYLNRVGLILGLGICILICLFGYFLIWEISESFVHFNPELTYMRWPILMGCYLMLAGAIGALVLGLERVRVPVQDIFSRATVQRLRWMRQLLMGSSLSMLGVYVYAWLQIGFGMGLVGFYFIIFILVFFTASAVMGFIENLFQRAVQFREENELTV